MIDLTLNPKQIKINAQRAKEKNIIYPTYAQMKDPNLIPEKYKEELKSIGLWDVHPRNLFRITWKNEPVASGGGFGGPNYIELPPEITGVKARIVALVGKWFPTGAHKVGATYGCIAPRLVTGQYDPINQKAVWPSTGNYCRGGAYNSALLGCDSIAILPEEMSDERFEWLSKIAGEVIPTPGCESNVKEIFDKCWELTNTRGDDIMIFNQFDELGNHLWHYEVTGNAVLEMMNDVMKNDKERFAGIVLSSGSAGTLGCGDFLKKKFRNLKVAAAEALQCPTLLNNGFGGHRIEGIGDKHIPWIHNVRETDLAIAVDDEATIRMLRLFNEEVGHNYLREQGVKQELIDQLELLGISSIGNLVGAIKFAKYYELTENDIVTTIFTDSMELYGSRLRQLRDERGVYSHDNAVKDYEMIHNIAIDNMLELDYYAKKRIHNLKYYTWIEQQGKDLKELNAQWYDHEEYWPAIHKLVPKIDELISAFNEEVLK
jgi:cysteine synthase